MRKVAYPIFLIKSNIIGEINDGEMVIGEMMVNFKCILGIGKLCWHNFEHNRLLLAHEHMLA